VFAKCGDSITASENFLVQIGDGAANLGAFSALAPTIEDYRGVSLSDGSNSLTRASSCARGGWTTADALAPPSAIARELDALNPEVLVLMFGTNDSQQMSAAQFETNLEQIVDAAEALGTVVSVSTIPPRTDYAGADALVIGINDRIRQVAGAKHLPLIDLYVALSPLPSRGIGADGVHPTVELLNGARVSDDFTPAGLRFGYNVRNLLTLQMLDRLCAIR
jgi:lysophospholipase L1-like esterase